MIRVKLFYIEERYRLGEGGEGHYRSIYIHHIKFPVTKVIYKFPIWKVFLKNF